MPREEEEVRAGRGPRQPPALPAWDTEAEKGKQGLGRKDNPLDSKMREEG